MTDFKAGKCDACGCKVTLVQDIIDDIKEVGSITHTIIGHDEKCKVKSEPW